MKIPRLLVTLVFAVITFQFSAANTTDVVQTTVLELYRKLPAEKVGRQAFSSTVNVERWQLENPKAQVISIKPIIVNDEIVAWSIDWIEKNERKFVFLSYVCQAKPFVVPQDMTTGQILQEAWSGTAKQLGLRDKATPIALCTASKTAGTVVYGIWYSYQDDNLVPKFINGNFTVGFRSNPAAYREHIQKMKTVTVPLPKSVESRPELVVALRNPIITEGATITMKPFIVEETKTWLEVRGPANSSGRYTEMVVTNVRLDRPYGMAGIRKGMYVLSINGVQVIGLTKSEFDEKVASSTFTGDPVIEISEKRGGKPRSITVSGELLRQYARPKGDTVAGLTP